MAAATKLRPAATQSTCSPAGRPRLHSLLAAHDSKGRHTSVLGASWLAGLPYNAPCKVYNVCNSTSMMCYQRLGSQSEGPIFPACCLP